MKGKSVSDTRSVENI